MGTVGKSEIIIAGGLGRGTGHRIMPGSTLGDCNRSGVAVVGKTMFLVVKSHTSPDNVLDCIGGGTEFIAVAVAIAQGAAVGKQSVAIGNAIFDYDRPDDSGAAFGIEIPAVIDVIVGDTAAENIAVTGCEFTGEPVRVFTVGIFVIIGIAI